MSFAQFSAGFKAKAVHFGVDHRCMDKINARLLPTAVVVTGLLSVFGGYFGNR